jgi:hypothetical protein
MTDYDEHPPQRKNGWMGRVNYDDYNDNIITETGTEGRARDDSEPQGKFDEKGTSHSTNS